MSEDSFPVSRALVIALALAFGLFNQVLFGLLGAAVVADGRVEVGTRLLGISVGVGAALCAACAVFLFTAQQRRWSDGVAGALAGQLAAWALVRGWNDGVAGAMGPLLLANLWLALWWSRGWLRKIVIRRRAPA